METTASAKQSVAQELGVVETNDSYETLLNETRIIPENAIVVPSAVGDVFGKQYNLCRKLYQDFHKDWKVSIKTFEEEGSINDKESEFYARENFVRWMVQTLQDYTYMQNPTAEFTSTEESDAKFAAAIQATVTALVNKASGIGINLRPNILKMILYAYLTNYAILKIEFVDNEGSREEALALYTKAQERLHEAKDAETVEESMALMDRLFRELQNRDNFGIIVKVLSPFQFFIDPEAVMNDFSDAKRTFEIEFIDEEMLKTRFMKFDAEQDQWYFKYDERVEYSGAVKQSTNDKATLQHQIVEELMPDASENERTVKLEGMVECIWVYDRTTRYYYLYIAGDWSTPLWVFEDNLKLSRFFPYFKLSFSPALRGLLTNSEVSYIKGFQDEINETNKQWKILRSVGFSTFIYNADEIDRQEVDKIFSEALKETSTSLKGIGVKLKDRDTALDRVIKPLLMPTAQAQPLFDNNKYIPALERASRISAAMQGSEFKTNTTNEAVGLYQEQLQSRTSSFIDPIEECVSEIMWALAEIVVSKLDKNSLTSLVSASVVQDMRSMEVSAFNQQFSMSVEAGSTEKPNSTNRKKEAVQIIQMLGQFGATAPQTVLGIVTRMLRKVFDRNMVTDTDLEMLKAEGDAYMQKGISTPGQGQPQTQENKQ